MQAINKMHSTPEIQLIICNSMSQVRTAGEIRSGSSVGNIAECIERGKTVLKSCLRAGVLLIHYVSTARGREEGRVALRQLYKVSWALQRALDLCFHVTSQCICWYFDSRLKGEDLD